MSIAARLISIRLIFFFFFVDGVLEGTDAGAGDGVNVGAGAGAVVDGVSVNATEGGTVRRRNDNDDNETGSAFVVEQNDVLAPREILFLGECPPFSGVAWRIAVLLPGSATSA